MFGNLVKVILQESGRAGLLSRDSSLPLSYNASVLFSFCWFYPPRPHPGSAHLSALPKVTIPNVSCPLEKAWVGGCVADLRSHWFLRNEAHSLNTFIQHNSTEAPQCANHLVKQKQKKTVPLKNLVMEKSEAHSKLKSLA